MPTQDHGAAGQDLRLAFFRHLPQRVDQIARRGRRFRAHGWDINGLSLLHDDVQRLGATAARYGALELGDPLQALEALLAGPLAAQQLPDADFEARLPDLLEALAAAVPAPPEPEPVPEPATPEAAADASAEDEFGLGVTLLQAGKVTLSVDTPNDEDGHFWDQWADLGDVVQPARPRPPEPPAARTPAPAPAPTPAPAPRPAPAPTPAAPAPAPVTPPTPTATAPTPRPAPPARPPSPPPRPAAAEPPKATGPRLGSAAPITRVPPKPEPAAQAHAGGRIYHLTDAGELACALDQRLETLGYELEILDTLDDLIELLSALPPDLVLADAGFLADLEGLGAPLRAVRQRTGARIPLLALSESDDVTARLAARRAGADLLLPQPRDAEAVLRRIPELLNPEREAPYRVLVVEDDRSQALFAESILRNAGMEARVVHEALQVLGAMDDFKPDLVLMDLHMPECDGAELTSLIRERSEYLDTPIVFLSGENDQDKQYEALDAGGDDFLSKPIRPKHLIAAVANRVKRVRAVRRLAPAGAPRVDPRTGLYPRAALLDALNTALAEDPARRDDGGVVLVEIDGIGALRERLGLTALEQLLASVGLQIAALLDSGEWVTRFGDGEFLLFLPARGEAALDTLADTLRTRLMAHPFTIGHQPLRLRLSLAVCGLRHGFADAGALLAVAERLCRDARQSARGVLRFVPDGDAVRDRQDALAGLLSQAVQDDAFELMYQPIVPVQGGEQAQYQTLVRLRAPGGRLHSAAEFIPLAAANDLLIDIDRWVVQQALDLIQLREAEGQPVRLFVTQSVRTLCAPDQAEWLRQQLALRRLGGARLVIEIAQHDLALAGERDTIALFCAALRALDVGFCLSGAEWNTLGEHLLAALPLEAVKLAGRYLGAGQTPALREELHALVEAAHARGVAVVAHRVEDAQSAATLWMAGIDYIQGNMVQQASAALDFDFNTAVF